MKTSDIKMTLTAEQLAPFFKQIKKQADNVMQYYLIGNFLFGLFLATFYSTWTIAILVGSINVLTYYVAKYLLPASSLYQYIGSAITAIFCAQFIYQMHGMFEMHFFVFVASLILIAYHNWKLQLPLILIVVVHHAAFAYLQYSGMKDIYFTQLDYMTLQAFIFHGAIATLIVFLSGYWSYDFRQKTINAARDSIFQEVQLAGMSKNISFAEELIKGNLEAVLEIEQGDELAKSMLNMKEELQKSYKREQEDKFIHTGIAQISDILRSHMRDVQTLCDQVIVKLVKYIDANQGGIFILEGEEENDLHLKLKSHYAYQRKKYQEKRIEIGQGLVGQAYLEKDTIYMTAVPQGYVTVTSGLGEATPNSILIVPLKYNDEVVGIMEVASFQEFKDFQIAFLEKVGESIASTITAVKINERTGRLLENTHLQTQALQAQEEEMRQNMEELAATQEEMQRKEHELQRLLQESMSREQRLNQEIDSLRNQRQISK